MFTPGEHAMAEMMNREVSDRPKAEIPTTLNAKEKIKPNGLS